MRILQVGLLSLWLMLVSCLPALSQDSSSSSSQGAANDTTGQSGGTLSAPAPASFNEVMDRVIQKEHFFLAQMRHMRPMVETYLQDLKTDSNGNAKPVKDQYFLGRLDMSDGPEDTSFVGQPGFGGRMLNRLTGLYAMQFLPLGFAQMVVLDTDFQKKYYDFTFVRREFLGEVRCLVIDVQPRENAPPGRFLGRIWVEDQDYNVVRFNGTYFPHPKNGYYLHFDSWRLNMRSGVWLPAYIYSEESDMKTSIGRPLRFRAQTRLWGYDLKGLNKNAEFTQILVDSPQSVRDQSDAAADATPVVAQRMWERQAEDNAVERLQKIGLLAPSGEVDKILMTVVNNLLVTNNIDLQSDVRCRVLLTSPLESFTIGHTIVVSRGLLDVLPDEASLAMVLAHELSHIVLGHPFDTKLAFNDRLFFPDEDSFQRLDFKRRSSDEDAADAKALELLKNSPYKDKLGSAGLFLKALQQSAPELPNLIRPHLGNSMASNKSIRMSVLLASAPELEPQRTDQIAALPLGGRIKLDPWTDQVELAKAKPVALASAREKMPFEITPFFPYLTRYPTPGSEKVALTAPAQK
ncbi:MAG: M48 family metalloprotease [Candidatus Sulfotelmatobacter sp.]